MPKTWSKPFLTILKAHASEWRSGNKLEREDLARTVAEEIRKDIVADSDDEEVPDDLENKVVNWFFNNVAKKKGPAEGSSKSKSGKTFSARDVVIITHRDQIFALINTRTEESSGQKNWLSLYPQALSDVLAGLSSEELEEAERLAEEWSDKGLPREEQRVNAERSFAHDVNAFLKEMHLKHGAQLFIMSAYERVDSSVAIAKKVLQVDNRHDPFTEVFPDWKNDLWDNWTKFVRNEFNYEPPDSEASSVSHKPRREHVSEIANHDEHGWPLIPSRGSRPLQECKDVLRAYVTATYRHYTHNKLASVPWKSLSQDLNYQFINSETLPEGAMLLDPSKLRIANISLLWSHWVRRQKANQQGLIFIKARKEDKRMHLPAAAVQHPIDPATLHCDPHQVDSLDNLLQEEGEQEPHPESPAAHASSKDSRIEFLRGLSSEPVYKSFVDWLNSHEEGEDTIAVTNLPTWGGWEWNKKFLPEEFHNSQSSILQLFKLAHENCLQMGSDAELVVLSIGLAIRDFAAIHFIEDDEFPPDFPTWVQSSPFGIPDINRLMTVWSKHLVAISNNPPNDSDPKGKSKGKGRGKGKGKDKAADSDKKREIQSVDKDSQPEEKQPPQKRGKMAKKSGEGPLRRNIPDEVRKLRRREKK